MHVSVKHTKWYFHSNTFYCVHYCVKYDLLVIKNKLHNSHTITETVKRVTGHYHTFYGIKLSISVFGKFNYLVKKYRFKQNISLINKPIVKIL